MKPVGHPPARPLRWDHIDVYAKFSVWDYEVSSDRNVPGFTILENVDPRGFTCSVREFLPDGELLPFVGVSVTTPAVYEKNALYTINDIESKSSTASQKTIRSDPAGRLTILLNGSAHEIGINKKTDVPNISIASVEIANMKWPTHRKEVTLSVKLLNKGISVGKNVTAKLSATRNNVTIKQGESEFGRLEVNHMQVGQRPFSFQVLLDSIEVVKFRLAIRDENKNEWVEFFEIPLKKDLPQITDFEIADGRVVTVAKGGNDTETILLGAGNGDGKANPGESIVILVRDQDKYWRTELRFSDPHINPSGIHIRKSDNWGSYDHVGGSAKYDIPLLSANCPENHSLSFFAEYWLPAYPLHSIKQGVITIEVKGKDTTPPVIGWLHVGNNTLQAKVYDGSKIQSVKAKLIAKDDPANSFDVELKDYGLEGDRTEADNVFIKKLSKRKFGMDRGFLEVIDSFGNRKTEESPEDFVVY